MKNNDYIDDIDNPFDNESNGQLEGADEESGNDRKNKRTQRKRNEEKEEKKQREALNAIRRYTDDEEGQDEDAEQLSIKSVIGGDILKSKFFVKQVAFIIFCVFLMVLYTANRYASQKEIIQIDKLNEQIQDAKNQRLLQESRLINLKRQSQIEAQLIQMGDTNMLKHNMPPYIIETNTEDNN